MNTAAMAANGFCQVLKPASIQGRSFAELYLPQVATVPCYGTMGLDPCRSRQKCSHFTRCSLILFMFLAGNSGDGNIYIYIL